ncbi:MAG: hypothetical protein ACJ0GH_04515 [Alphaproteobacteria bacterium]|tara:strand:+ start:192 stop:452 length:261 start_codon:yes stop_codon:yes gene_type:complete
MKIFFFSNYLVLITMIISTTLVVTNQNNQIKIVNQKLNNIDLEIEKLKTDLAYISSPKKLKEINNAEFRLIPIIQNNIIPLEKLYE